MIRHLFTYGTLQPDSAPKEIADVVNQFEFVGKGELQGVLFDFGKYPGILRSSDTTARVKGAIFQLPNDPKILKRLDKYEGFNPQDPENSLFIRERRTVSMRNGTRKSCWVYRYNQPLRGAKKVAGGKYRSKAILAH